MLQIASPRTSPRNAGESFGEAACLGLAVPPKGDLAVELFVARAPGARKKAVRTPSLSL